jgi:threonine/homoserine/homoserine lactone efflux protein
LPAAGAKCSLLGAILTEVLNIKTAMFFLAFIPQFVDAHNPRWLLEKQHI